MQCTHVCLLFVWSGGRTLWPSCMTHMVACLKIPSGLFNPIIIVYNRTDFRRNCKILHAKTLYQLKKYISKFLIPLSTNTLLLWHWELSLPLVFNRHIRSIQKWQQEVFSSLLPVEDDAITSPSIVQLSCLFQNQENQDASGRYEQYYFSRDSRVG